MTTLYKLTDAKGQTYGGTQWGPGVTHTASGTGELCTAGWLHAYVHPLLAVIRNPADANFLNPRLWEAEGEIGWNDHSLKVGCTRLTTLREIPLPEMTTRQRVAFAILCVREAYQEASWRIWSEKWLSGEDRSTAAAARAANAAAAVAYAAAANAAVAIAASRAADAASRAADAAAAVAYADAAVAAAAIAVIDLIALVEQAEKYI